MIKRGVKKRIFGLVLFFLGILNTLLSIKAGVEIQGFYFILMATGVIIFIYGLWQGKHPT
ncbi:MAG: hypothetical protein HY878_01015 [Deltaproteobacteria bacterium]|nr:hypothetical protein [Deltaproteobacteria bacterium]